MFNTFYITRTKSAGNDWYMLLLRDTHFCVTSGVDLDKIVLVLKTYVKRYRTRERLYSAMKRLECKGEVSPATYAQRSEYYRLHGEDFEDLVIEVIREAIAEAREEDKVNSPLNKARTRLKKAGGVKTMPKPIVDLPKTSPTTIKDSPKILRRPKVFKHK